VLVDLVQTITRDGVRLDGSFQEPTLSVGPGLPDAVCFVHGTGGNFYTSTLFDHLAGRFLQQGVAVLRVNTRGHDLISNATNARGGIRLGAAYEVLDDCRQDLAAWLEWLGQRGCKRLALLGHSSGAIKCLYALAHDPDLPVVCAIALSPPRLSYSWFCAGPQRQVFLDTFQRAEQLVAQEQPAALLEAPVPLPMAITAAGYLEKYGPDERYNFLRFVAGVACPTLLTLGSIEAEKHTAFQGTAEALQKLFPRPKRLTVATIPGGDHMYTDVRGELSEVVEQWLQSRGGGQG
jgi:pimeloyl-ACP methyl ester carboxylesterase